MRQPDLLDMPQTNGEPKDSSAKTLGQVMRSVSGHLDPDVIGSGLLAELRRMDWNEFPPGFWRFYLSYVPAEWREPGGYPPPDLDRAWATILRAMAECGPRPLAFALSFGAGLAKTDYSEARFVRILRANGRDFARELRVAAAWLARNGVKANWVEPAELALVRLGNLRRAGDQRWLRSADELTHRMARDYFRAAAAHERS